jgi:lsr operon transcriptional repressor
MALNASYQLVGIGELSAISTVVRSGYVSPDEVEPLRRKGAPSVSWQGAALLSA